MRIDEFELLRAAELQPGQKLPSDCDFESSLGARAAFGKCYS